MKNLIPVSIFTLSVASLFPYGAVAAPSAVQQQNTIVVDHQINLNQANAIDLNHSVKGIGTKRAEAIVAYRQKHGAFKSINDLAYVPGFGNNFVKKNQAELEKIFIVK